MIRDTPPSLARGIRFYASPQPIPQGNSSHPPCLPHPTAPPPLGNGGDPHDVRLTSEDWQILVLNAHGHPRRQIAARLGLSPAAVSIAWLRIYAQLGVQTRKAAQTWYRAYIAAASTVYRTTWQA